MAYLLIDNQAVKVQLLAKRIFYTTNSSNNEKREQIHFLVKYNERYEDRSIEEIYFELEELDTKPRQEIHVM
jgi:hypothetical protein